MARRTDVPFSRTRVKPSDLVGGSIDGFTAGFPLQGSARRWDDPDRQWPGAADTGPPPADGTGIILPAGDTLLGAGMLHSGICKLG